MTEKRLRTCRRLHQYAANVHPHSTVGYPWMGDNWYMAVKSYLH